MCVRVRGEPRRAETRSERASERTGRTEGGTEREGKKRRVTDFESARTSLARVRGCRHGGRGRKGGGERERRALEGERGRSENESVCIYARVHVCACVCVCMKWEVSSEGGEGKRKGSDIPEGRLVGKELMHAKGGAGRKTGRGGERKGSGRAREGGREGREYEECIWLSYK